MTEQEKTLAERISEAFEGKVRDVSVAADGIVTCEVLPEHWLSVARGLRDDEQFAFEQLTDLCGVDYFTYGMDEWRTDEATKEGFSRGVVAEVTPGRFDWEDRPQVEMENRYAVVVHLISVKHNHRVRMRTLAADWEMPTVPSLVDIWNGVNWFEREAFDMYGIVFEGHPDLRRILTDYGFVGHPFRKDFPLIGNVEMRYDEEKGRVIYEPVTIEPRTLVPKVIREDSRYVDSKEDGLHG